MQKETSAPIIFCHFGNSEYLQYSLKCAVLNNPDKRVILLGDETNKWLSDYVEHYMFEDFYRSEEQKTFDQVYKLVKGKKHVHTRSGQDWVKFVFKRWFVMLNFLKQQEINNFWAFDSDTMIVDSLGAHEKKFNDYDCTEQCNGKCISGYVSNIGVVQRYIDKINDLFQREAYLTSLQQSFNTTGSENAFTIMAAYVKFKEEEKVNAVRLNTIRDESTFDDCICFDHGMRMESLRGGKSIKTIYLNSDGRFFCCEQSSGHLIKLNSINLSWVPTYLFKIALAHSQLRANSKTDVEPDISKLNTLSSVPIPIEYLVKERLRQVKRLFYKSMPH